MKDTELKDILEATGLSEDTVSQLSEMLEEAITQAREDALKEQAERLRGETESEAIAAMQEQHAAEIAELKEQAEAYGDYLKEQANAYADYIKEENLKVVGDYANYVAEQFVQENRESLIATEEYHRMRDSFNLIKEAFEVNGFDVDDSALVSKMETELAESRALADKLFAELTEVREMAESMKREIIFNAATENLTESQREDVRELLEQVDADSSDEYESIVKFTVERLNESNNVSTLNNEVITEDGNDKRTSPVSRYTQGW